MEYCNVARRAPAGLVLPLSKSRRSPTGHARLRNLAEGGHFVSGDLMRRERCGTGLADIEDTMRTTKRFHCGLCLAGCFGVLSITIRRTHSSGPVHESEGAHLPATRKRRHEFVISDSSRGAVLGGAGRPRRIDRSRPEDPCRGVCQRDPELGRLCRRLLPAASENRKWRAEEDPNHLAREKHLQEVRRQRIEQQFQDVLKGDLTDELNWLLVELSGPTLALHYVADKISVADSKRLGPAVEDCTISAADARLIQFSDGRLTFSAADPQILDVTLAVCSPGARV